MTSKPLLDGSRAKVIFGESAHVAMKVVDALGEALLAEHNGDHDAALQTLTAGLKDAMMVYRILVLLEAGNYEAAESLITRKKS
jgi:hypothetical protein